MGVVSLIELSSGGRFLWSIPTMMNVIVGSLQQH